MKINKEHNRNNIVKKMMPIFIIGCLLFTNVGFLGCLNGTTKQEIGYGLKEENKILMFDTTILGNNLYIDENGKINSIDTFGGGDGYRTDSSIRGVVNGMLSESILFSDNVTINGILTTNTFITPYQQVVTVAKQGGDFTTIQDAIDSITDATTLKRYCIRVMSGVYTEAVTCKNYVDIIGSGRTNSIISGINGTVLTFPSVKCTISEIGIVVDYGILDADSTAITSACTDAVLKDCDITVTKSGGDYLMNGMMITAGSFRMSDCYFMYSDTSGGTETKLTQSAIVQTGILSNVILNNNEFTVTTNDTNDDLVGFETTATVIGTCLLTNNVLNVDTGTDASSATGIWAYGTCSGAIFNQNRLTVNCSASAYGLWIDSVAGGAVIDTRHNEIIVTSVGAALSAYVETDDTWNSVLDKITAASGYISTGTVSMVSSPIDGGFVLSGNINVTGGYSTDTGTGWSGWIDDGANVNSTYRHGILIAVSATSGVAGYKTD